ncbi:hypothetical protein [Roseovarius pelagicus]|uniref:Uncharacterized protein n=1 Tax=Roseovarius pelagicus TaxID=2980108 RepID=A0ABY6DEL6_9RHOB|nr:hypothetical protein [Roseovarius pelagicus]UXX82250.1 hypothetical protein N7U68_14220 [Roseovarius pelagicus]
MDLIALGFYAMICGVLGLAGPRLGAAPMRLGIGAVVGIAAAATLPFIKAAIAG